MPFCMRAPLSASPGRAVAPPALRVGCSPDENYGEEMTMPKYLFEVSYSPQGVEGLRSKGGSNRRMRSPRWRKTSAAWSRASTSRSAITMPT